MAWQLQIFFDIRGDIKGKKMKKDEEIHSRSYGTDLDVLGIIIPVDWDEKGGDEGDNSVKEDKEEEEDEDDDENNAYECGWVLIENMYT